jgi:hypothetical protein
MKARMAAGAPALTAVVVDTGIRAKVVTIRSLSKALTGSMS